MNTDAVQKPRNVLPLADILHAAERGGYAVGSFAPRYTPMIEPILRAGQATESPLIVQISQKELDRYGITPEEFATEFYRLVRDGRIALPLVLHLDHTKDREVIRRAISSGFTSVMIDASDKSLEENIAITREIAREAHEKGVSVEAELGRIGTTDFVETETNEEMYTDPEEAGRFFRETGVDALAVSVGTSHGVYKTQKPTIDFARLREIRSHASVPMVLHGGSGVPSDLMDQAIRMPEGGVSKVNIATDLELALLGTLGRDERMTNQECMALPPEELKLGQEAVRRTVEDKIIHFVRSQGHARDFEL